MIRTHKKKLRRHKRKTMRFRGGTSAKCCMCENKYDKKDMLTPRKCSKVNFMKSHKICKDCWWDKKSGFALENRDHKCPGCIKKMPLTSVPQIKEVINLTDSE